MRRWLRRWLWGHVRCLHCGQRRDRVDARSCVTTHWVRLGHPGSLDPHRWPENEVRVRITPPADLQP